MLRGSIPSSSFDARAFTLIELLVVIGIISILVGLSFPAIGMVQRYSHIAGDLSNLRGLSIAHAAYMNVFKDHFVDAGLPHGGIGNVKNSFVQTLRPYYGGVMSVKSPLDNSHTGHKMLENLGLQLEVAHRLRIAKRVMD